MTAHTTQSSLSFSAASTQGLEGPLRPITDLPVARFKWFEYQGNDPALEGNPILEGESSAAHFTNPILAGWHSDPSIVAVGQDFYLITSTFAYFPGIPVYHSRDLVSWTQIGNAIARSEQLDFSDLETSRGVFASSIAHHQGIFYIASTSADGGGNFLITASNPAGPWSDPLWLPRVDGIDPSIFFDDDGTSWIVHNGPPAGAPRYEGHRALWIHQYDHGSGQTVSQPKIIVDGGVNLENHPIWIEGPHLIKKEGVYYLIASEGGTAEDHSMVVFRSQSVTGPYVPWQDNPILTQRDLSPERPHPITSAGHADFVRLPDGAWWCVFLAARPYRDDFYNTGRETFLLPVDWSGEWPLILPRGEAISYQVPRPALPQQPAAHHPNAGNFTQRDEFEGELLPLHWLSVRNPNGHWFRLHQGALELFANPQRLQDRSSSQAAFLGRRQQQQHMTATTHLTLHPQGSFVKVGLAAFQNSAYWYFFGLVYQGREVQLRVELRAGEDPAAPGQELVRVALELPADQAVLLRICARGAFYDFEYAEPGGAWQSVLSGADATVLSSKTAGGFVGTLIGPYSTITP